MCKLISDEIKSLELHLFAVRSTASIVFFIWSHSCCWPVTVVVTKLTDFDLWMDIGHWVNARNDSCISIESFCGFFFAAIFVLCFVSWFKCKREINHHQTVRIGAPMICGCASIANLFAPFQKEWNKNNNNKQLLRAFSMWSFRWRYLWCFHLRIITSAAFFIRFDSGSPFNRIKCFDNFVALIHLKVSFHLCRLHWAQCHIAWWTVCLCLCIANKNYSPHSELI